MTPTRLLQATARLRFFSMLEALRASCLTTVVNPPLRIRLPLFPT